MHVLLIIGYISIFVSSFDEENISKHIKNYEIVDCFVSNSRSRRDLFIKNERINKSFDAEVRFKSYDIYFHLLLTEDISFKKLKVESYSLKNSIESQNITIKILEGVMKNKSVPSYVAGYLKDDVFTGSVNFHETFYFVEPARKYFSNYTFENKILVYRENDVVYKKENYSTNLIDQTVDDYKSILKGINKTGNEREDYACIMEFVSDHLLYEYFGRDANEVAAYMYLHGKFADNIFRRTDFDGDGKSDRIRIIVNKIFIYKNKNDPNYPMKEASDMNSYMNKFAFRNQEYCLAVCVTARVFTNGRIGAAFKPSRSDSDSGTPGGICQKPFKNRSLNVAAFTIKSSKGSTLPLSITLLTLAHELGHSFGSDHDSIGNLLCSPGGSSGYYLMHAWSQNKRNPLVSFFSPCSKKQIYSVISARGECLKPHPATCGNGVQEGNEDCDCGSREFCQYVDPCCTPFNAEAPEEGCTFNKVRGATCSPREDSCCLSKCKINTDENFMCYKEFRECEASFCDGNSRICPEPRKAPDGFPCQGTSKSCVRGICNSSVCLDNDLTDCVCEDIKFECYVCCKKGGKCVTASSLGFKTFDGQLHYSSEGSHCNFMRYQCDGSGICVNPSQRYLTKQTGKHVIFWVGIGLLMCILIICLIFFSSRLYKM